MLLYGPPKIGKSSFCSKLDDVVLVDTEGGLDWVKDIDAKRKSIQSWKEFQSLVTGMQSDGKVKLDNGKYAKPLHLVLDTADILWIYCTEYICRKHGFDHPSDESFGKGYQVLRYEFQRGLARLNTCKGVSMCLISHSKAIEVRGRGSNRTSQIVPTIPNSAREVVMPMMDIIGYVGFRVADEETDNERSILFAPEEGLEAGDRTGRLPKAMPLDADELDKYFGSKAGKASKGTKPKLKRKIGLKSRG